MTINKVGAQVQCPVAIVDGNLDRVPAKARAATRAAAEAFIQYLFQPAAQREFAACGFRCDQMWLVRRSKKGAWPFTPLLLFSEVVPV